MRQRAGTWRGAKPGPASASAVGGRGRIELIDRRSSLDLERCVVTVEPLHHPDRLVGRLFDGLVERIPWSDDQSRLSVDLLAETTGDRRPLPTDQENGLLDQTDALIGAIHPARQRCPGGYVRGWQSNS